ncbi:hypothetical protein JTE90_029493 [Oedothorax gibbosus]|uniref:Uncharacterized protein n=1 Tax=Oedothorax gibbosus TaxID=931172 RepID=A0AAV6V548_9ARAC|nr:hypothetical protein JTE90_029493 [Oedothorax gibbosus]
MGRRWPLDASSEMITKLRKIQLCISLQYRSKLPLYESPKRLQRVEKSVVHQISESGFQKRVNTSTYPPRQMWVRCRTQALKTASKGPCRQSFYDHGQTSAFTTTSSVARPPLEIGVSRERPMTIAR